MATITISSIYELKAAKLIGLCMRSSLRWNRQDLQRK